MTQILLWTVPSADQARWVAGLIQSTSSESSSPADLPAYTIRTRMNPDGCSFSSSIRNHGKMGQQGMV